MENVKVEKLHLSPLLTSSTIQLSDRVALIRETVYSSSDLVNLINNVFLLFEKIKNETCHFLIFIYIKP